MAKKVKCSECRNLKNSNSPETFINAQGINETHFKKRYRCKADISKSFSDKEIKEIQDCDKFRPRTLTFKQECFYNILNFNFIKSVINFFNKN